MIRQSRKLIILKWLYLHAKEAVDNFGIHLLIQVFFFPEKGFALSKEKHEQTKKGPCCLSC